MGMVSFCVPRDLKRHPKGDSPEFNHPKCGESVKNKKAAILRSELEELRDQIASLQSALDEKPDYGLGKGAPAVTQWELDRALLKRLKEQVSGIERALSNMSEAEYGICEQCGKPIHPDRLAVLPNTRVCIECAKGES